MPPKCHEEANWYRTKSTRKKNIVFMVLKWASTRGSLESLVVCAVFFLCFHKEWSKRRKEIRERKKGDRDSIVKKIIKFKF